MRASTRRQELIRKVMDICLKRLRMAWFCRDEPLKRNWKNLLTHSCVSDVIALHDKESKAWLHRNWANVGLLSKAFVTAASPINDLNAYYGEEVAFYFAFVEHYNRWLLGPSLFGTIIFIIQISVATETLDSDALVVYMILIACWSTLFLESWSRKQNTLAHLWGVLLTSALHQFHPSPPPSINFRHPFTPPLPSVSCAQRLMHLRDAQSMKNGIKDEWVLHLGDAPRDGRPDAGGL